MTGVIIDRHSLVETTDAMEDVNVRICSGTADAIWRTPVLRGDPKTLIFQFDAGCDRPGTVDAVRRV